MGLSPAYKILTFTLSSIQFSEAEATLPGSGSQWLTKSHHGSCLEVPPSYQGPVRLGKWGLGMKSWWWSAKGNLEVGPWERGQNTEDIHRQEL